MVGRARRIIPEELDTWVASPMVPSEKGYRDWVESESNFARNIPIHNLLIFEQVDFSLENWLLFMKIGILLFSWHQRFRKIPASEELHQAFSSVLKQRHHPGAFPS